MLSSDTKRKIDAARDILVGKIPVPTAQVEQITLAMVYKFMSDIDKQARAAGEKEGFFANGYSTYTWDTFMDKSLSAQQRLKLYAEALEKMSQNPHIPQLFRDIFKGAYLPFRDPEILKLFLEQIDEFTYDHSEELGNAFEYLLQVMGSQGDAGQFRTPRHIIDFIINCVEPSKHDRILDPACGTAGFLISAYKYLIEKGLTTTEKASITHNFTGYDISHEMVRLSRVNMYLHSFPNPNIIEYDTLTDLKYWDEDFDCILANPPFMSPKGGIRPHNRFQISANRSEVLFVDYILEHLSPTGKAGVIVPEGIIFQSANAYKNLRKLMIDSGYLWGVISLPSGVFNPYAGVKTSILLFDKSIGSIAKDVLFVKIGNDGYDLGAQRRKIEKNDLPEALGLILMYKKYMLTANTQQLTFQDYLEKSDQNTNKYSNYACVSKSKISEDGHYALTPEKYKDDSFPTKTSYSKIALGSVAEINPSKRELSNITRNLKVSFVPMADLNERNPYFIPTTSKTIAEVISGFTYFKNGDVLMAKITPCFENGKAGIARDLKNGIGFGSTEFIVVRPSTNKILPEIIYWVLQNDKFRKRAINSMRGAAGQKRVPSELLKTFEIPLPPLNVQQQIVDEIEKYQKIIDGAQQVVDNWRPSIKTDPNWDKFKISDIGKVCMCRRIFKDQTSIKGDVPFYKIGTFGKSPDAYIDKKLFEEYKNKYPYPSKGSILLSTSGTIGKTVIFDGKPAYFQDSNIVWIDNDEKIVSNEYLYFLFHMFDWVTTKGGIIERLYNNLIENTTLYLPPLEIQKQIVEKIQAEQNVIIANKELIEIYQQKIKAVINEIWDRN